MYRYRLTTRILAAVFSLTVAGGRALADDIPLKNWPVPTVSGGRTALGLNEPSTFVGITPCRVADTRGPNGTYGAPSLTASTPRDFPITGQCGIPVGPTGASAVSFNFTVLNTAGSGYLTVYPQGGQQPAVSTLNYNQAANPPIANAAIVALGTNGGLTVVAMNAGCDLIIDVNGYWFDKNGLLPITGGATHYLGIVGTVDPVGGIPYGVIFAQNKSTLQAYSIKADISNANADAAAIIGRQVGTGGGVNYGVLGINSSTGTGAAGVRGVTTSASGYGVVGAASTPTSNYGVFSQGNFGGTGTKFFVEPHPDDPAKTIRYVALEGPEAGTYFRARGRLQDGTARINVPADFRIVTEATGLTVHVTPIGGPANVWVAEVSLDEIILHSTHEVEFSVLVHGVRKAFRDFSPIAIGEEFVPESAAARIPEWLTDEARRRLIENGTYNEDGTVNMNTARRLGWEARWERR